jgi:glutamate dehydrogenase
MDRSSHLKNDLLQSLFKIAEERFSPTKSRELALFLENFFRHVPPSDIFDHDPEDLFGAAVTIWQFAQDRQPGDVKLRAYNPRFESDGWQSSHSVIEIINDDMPFLVDSVTAALNQMGLTVHLVIHPIIHLDRRPAGKPKLLDGATDGTTTGAESFMHVQVSAQSSEQDLANIQANLQHVLSDVRAAVEDWNSMRKQMRAVIKTVSQPQLPKNLTDEIDATEILAFLTWIEDNNFTFLGYRAYDYVGRGKTARIEEAGPTFY